MSTPLSIPCPTCHVPPGRLCTHKNGCYVRTPGGLVHQARTSAAPAPAALPSSAAPASAATQIVSTLPVAGQSIDVFRASKKVWYPARIHVLERRADGLVCIGCYADVDGAEVKWTVFLDDEGITWRRQTLGMASGHHEIELTSPVVALVPEKRTLGKLPAQEVAKRIGASASSIQIPQSTDHDPDCE